MNVIPGSELIINDRGAIYHVGCRPEEIAHTIITVGDPERVKEVSKHFDSIEFINQHREFITHTGYIGKKRLSVTSTGIGTDNIDIVLNELDALVNIDFDSRTVKDKLTTLKIIRIGSSGSLQEAIRVDSYVVSTHGLGLDNLMNFYHQTSNEEEKQLLHSFNNHTQIHQGIAAPYITGANVSLLKEFVHGFHQGITVTCPGFYGPQGRVLRMGLTLPHLINRLTSFSFGQHRITNFEMETSAIYGMSRILGHQCLSLSAIAFNRINKEFTKDGQKAVNGLIEKTLEIVSSSIL